MESRQLRIHCSSEELSFVRAARRLKISAKPQTQSARSADERSRREVMTDETSSPIELTLAGPIA